MTDNQQTNLPDWARHSQAIGPAQYGPSHSNYNIGQGDGTGGYGQQQQFGGGSQYTGGQGTGLPNWAHANPQGLNQGNVGPSYTNYNTPQSGGGGYSQQQFGGGSQYTGGQDTGLPNWAHANPQGTNQGNVGPSYTNYNTPQSGGSGGGYGQQQQFGGGSQYAGGQGGPSYTNYNTPQSGGSGGGYGQQQQFGGGGGQGSNLPGWAHAYSQGMNYNAGQANRNSNQHGPSYTDYNAHTPGPGPR